MGLFLSLPRVSAQITGGGSITGIISGTLGINVAEPYQALGVAATVGVMWVSAYVIFKIGIKKLDEGLDNGRSGGLADAVGIGSQDDRNILAVLTLLIVLSTLGTGAFMGLIQGWQSLILLGFSFMLLAGLLFILIGGTGGIIGGGAWMTGKSAQMAAEGLEEALEQTDRIRGEEGEVDEIEEDVEDEEQDADGRNDDGEDGNGEEVEREIEDIIRKIERASKLIEDIENRLDSSLDTEIDALKDETQHLRELAKLLGIQGRHELLEELEKILKRIGLTEDEIKELLSTNDPAEAEKKAENILDGRTYDLSSDGEEVLSRYLDELQEIKSELENMDEIRELYSKLQELLEHLEQELQQLESEEHTLEDLISNLQHARENSDVMQEIDQERRELQKLEENLEKLEEERSALKELENTLEKFLDRMGSLEDIKNAIEAREMTLEKIEEFSGDFSTTSLIGFNRERSVYPEKGMVVTPSGAASVVFDEVIYYEGDSSRSSNPIRISENIPDIVEEFRNEIKQEVEKENRSGKVKTSRDEILGFIVNLLGNINGKMRERSTDLDTRRVNFSEAVENRVFDAGVLNAVYMGFMIEEFRAIYLGEIVDSKNRSKIGTWRLVRETLEALEPSLASYGGSTVILVEVNGDLSFGLDPASGELIDNPDPDRIGEIKYAFL
jgi:hypothetical protein